MPPSLLHSQLATLEPLEDDEPGVARLRRGGAAEVLDRALAALDAERGLDAETPRRLPS